MPYKFRPLLIVACAGIAAAVPQVVRPLTGADGAAILALVPAAVGAWVGGWREALIVVWIGSAAIQFAEPPSVWAAESGWHPATVWGCVGATVGTVACLALRRHSVCAALQASAAAQRHLQGTESGPVHDTQELLEADARKDEALAILAHELRNPLAPIQTAAELIRRVSNSAERDRWSRIIEAQVKILVRLVDDLLDISRIQRGTVEINKGTVDLVALVQEAAESARPEMNVRRHDFFVGTPTDGPVYVEADMQRISQVLYNLLNNAAKYTPPGGRVELSLERVPGGATIRVADTGIGIAPAYLPRIWDMFVQVRTGLDREGGGIGLGLTLVKKLVELHGGTVTARSDGEGKGSEFLVTLPRPSVTWKAVRRSVPPDGSRASLKSLKVLIVEDNLPAAETLAAHLRLEGHSVSVVHDGTAAVATAAVYLPDAVLLDIGLPGIDGYEIARRLRRSACEAVLIATTGCATEENRASGSEAGIDHYLLKPVPFDTLRKLMGAPRPLPGCGVGYDRIS